VSDCTGDKLEYDCANPKSAGDAMTIPTPTLNRNPFKATTLLIAVIFSGWLSPVIAEEMTSHGSHVHGEAQLTFVLDGNEAELALVTAAGNIIGFEHEPVTVEEQQQQKTQLEMLQSGRWFVADADANCTMAGQEVRAEPDEHDHGDLFANIQLLCQAPLKLQNLQFSLFELAPGLSTIKVQFLIDGEAGVQELNANQSTLKLRD
jgi:hypothetical protein